jgi:hypothetical protein
MRLNEKEQKVLRIIAKWYKEGRNDIDRMSAITELRISDFEYNTIMLLMEHIGAIEAMHGQPSDGPNYVALDFTPLCYSEQLVRQIDEQIEIEKRVAPPDIVQQLLSRVRQNPWTAWTIIVFLVLSLLVPLLNGFWELLEKIMSLFSGK